VGLRGPDTVAVLLGDGEGGFAEAPGSPHPAGGEVRRVAVADVDDDGDLDVVVALRSPGRVPVLRNFDD